MAHTSLKPWPFVVSLLLVFGCEKQPEHASEKPTVAAVPDSSTPQADIVQIEDRRPLLDTSQAYPVTQNAELDSFLKRFFSDSTFQLQHIAFPIPEHDIKPFSWTADGWTVRHYPIIKLSPGDTSHLVFERTQGSGFFEENGGLRGWQEWAWSFRFEKKAGVWKLVYYWERGAMPRNAKLP